MRQLRDIEKFSQLADEAMRGLRRFERWEPGGMVWYFCSIPWATRKDAQRLVLLPTQPNIKGLPFSTNSLPFFPSFSSRRWKVRIFHQET